MKRLLKLGLCIAVLAAPMSGMVQAQEKLKIGVLSTMSGPGGVMGRHHRDGGVIIAMAPCSRSSS